MANIIPLGNTAATSGDLVVVNPTTIHGVGTGAWTAQIQIKNSNGTYTTLGGITELNPAQTIYGPGTYRVARPLTGVAVACLVDQD